MASIRDIKRQIVSVQNTQKVTKAMKMVSAAKMRRAADAITSSKPYNEKITDIMGRLLKIVEGSRNEDSFDTEQNKGYSHPLLEKSKEVRKIALFIVSSDRGLCGAFNANIVKYVTQFVEEHKDKEIELFIVGKNAYDYFRKRDFKITNKWVALGGKISYESSKKICEALVDGFLKKNYDEVYAIYNKLHSITFQSPEAELLLPVNTDSHNEHAEESGVENDGQLGTQQDIEYLFEPGPEKILDLMIPKYVALRVNGMLLESAVGEHRARMVAMENATRNADDMVKKLQLYYNKARQAAITTDLLDIINGAEALK